MCTNSRGLERKAGVSQGAGRSDHGDGVLAHLQVREGEEGPRPLILNGFIKKQKRIADAHAKARPTCKQNRWKCQEQ